MNEKESALDARAAEKNNPLYGTWATRVLRPFTELFGLSVWIAAVTVVIIAGITVVAIYYFIHLAPPRLITVTSGPTNSAFDTFARRYQTILASNGVTLRILTSEGSQQNLQRLGDSAVKVDMAFVQSGIRASATKERIISLGSVSYQPLLIFYRAPTNFTVLAEFQGKQLAVGTAGSGTRILATSLLASNGVTGGNGTTFLDLEASAAAAALKSGGVDAVFLTGDSAPVQVITNLLHHPGIRLFNFVQAEAYARRISYLNKLEFPMGSLDFAGNLPKEDVYLVAPTVELLARESLHPALIDAVLEAAREVHGQSSLLKRKGEFPAPLEQERPISPEALRYYKSGKTFMYQHFPFWVASVVNRMLLVVIPAIVLLIPALRFIPRMLQWRTRLRIYRWYRALLLFENDLNAPMMPQRRKELLQRLEEIEGHVGKMKVPVSFADQYYALRGHINFVRGRLGE